MFSDCVSPLCAAVQKGFAQIDTASIEGRVVDSPGAFIVPAQVQAINVDTNYVYTVKSNQNGEWVISPMRIGTYRVNVSAAGFHVQFLSTTLTSLQGLNNVHPQRQTTKAYGINRRKMKASDREFPQNSQRRREAS
jgi:hypothetical protein